TTACHASTENRSSFSSTCSVISGSRKPRSEFPVKFDLTLVRAVDGALVSEENRVRLLAAWMRVG
ncbi:MAG: hypothetical protein ACKOAP_02620, partial [Vulcanococcus sp.]